MSIISIVSPKGGAGKSTLVITIATMLAKLNADVCIVDADPQQTASRWYYGSSAEDDIKTHHKIAVIKNVSEDDFYSVVRDAANKHRIVIIDTSGRANLTMSRAILAADLVLIPTKPSTVDIEAAIHALKLIKNEELGAKREIPHAIILTEMPATDNFVTPVTREFINEVKKADIHLMQVQLVKREAYRQMFYYRVGVDELPDKPDNVTKVVNNALNLVREILTFLQASAAQKTN